MKNIILTPWGCICESCFSNTDEFAEHHTAHAWCHGEGCQCDTGREAPPSAQDPRWPQLPDGFRYLTEAELARGEYGSACESCCEPWEPVPSESERLEAWVDSESDPNDVDRPSF